MARRTHFPGGVKGPLTFSGSETAVAGAATTASLGGKITTEALTTAQDATYTLTITNSNVAATSMAFASVAYGTCSTGTPMVGRVTCGASSLVITVTNKHASAVAFNGTLVISYKVFVVE
jgi:hypothetical protein